MALLKEPFFGACAGQYARNARTGDLPVNNRIDVSERTPIAICQARTIVHRGEAQVSTAITQKSIRLKRAYEPASRDDGVRILVDRLWPRGLRKADAAFDMWMKEIAPSAELRRWFAHDPARWQEFQRRYRAELAQHQTEIAQLRDLARRGPITLIFAARDQNHNEAIVLRDYLLHQ